MEITQVSLSQEDGDLATENSEGEFLPIKLGNGTDDVKALFAFPMEFLVKGVMRQEMV